MKPFSQLTILTIITLGVIFSVFYNYQKSFRENYTLTPSKGVVYINTKDGNNLTISPQHDVVDNDLDFSEKPYPGVIKGVINSQRSSDFPYLLGQVITFDKDRNKVQHTYETDIRGKTTLAITGSTTIYKGGAFYLTHIDSRLPITIKTNPTRNTATLTTHLCETTVQGSDLTVFTQSAPKQLRISHPYTNPFEIQFTMEVECI